MSKRNDPFGYSLRINEQTYIDYFDRLRGICENRIIWDGLPSTISARYLNEVLFYQGRVLIFCDPDIGLLALPYTGGGCRTVYNEPTERTAYAVTGYRATRTAADSVILYANTEQTAPAAMVEGYAMRLYEIQRAIDTNVKAQKTPVLVQCDEKQRLTFENLWQKYDGNQAVIFATSRLDADAVKVLTTHADYKAGELQALKERTYNEALSAMGVANLTETKRERMVRDEVARSVGGAFAARASVMSAANDAARQIRDIFGVEIVPRYNDFGDTSDGNPDTDDTTGEGVEM